VNVGHMLGFTNRFKEILGGKSKSIKRARLASLLCDIETLNLVGCKLTEQLVLTVEEEILSL